MRIVAGTHKSRAILAPKGQTTRPTSEKLRAALFNICQQSIQEASFLDIFAGSGAMGLEALSRGAKHATFIDVGRECIQCIRENVKNFGFENSATILQGDVFTMLARLASQGKRFDIIYADPPYNVEAHYDNKIATYSTHILNIVDTSSLLVEGGTLFIEEEKSSQPIDKDLKSLKLVNTRQMGHSSLQQYQSVT